MKQILELFPDVDTFLQSNDEFSSATRSRLIIVLSDPQKIALLKVKLAVTVDFGHQFFTTMYNLEGDRSLVFQCYENVSALTASVNIANFPNLNAVAKELSAGNAVIEQQLTAYGKTCINPAVQYYQQRLEDSMKIPLQAFKAAREKKFDAL